MARRARSATFCVCVAEKRAVCRLEVGSSLMIARMSSSNPISRMRSASSMVSTWRLVKTKPLVEERWSSSRPGVPTRWHTPFASLSASARRLAPPMTRPNVCRCEAHSSESTPKIWSASSRVGEMVIAPVPWRGAHFARASSSTAGMRNESVLPEPVLAWARTSWPRSSGGIERAWISVSVSNFMAASASRVSCSSSSESNRTPMKDSGGSSSPNSSASASLAATSASAASRSARSSAASIAMDLSGALPERFTFLTFFGGGWTTSASPLSSSSSSPPSLAPGDLECVRTRFRLRTLGPSGGAPSEAFTSGTKPR
mmetsp:Transcript_4279/g.9393  ORF Transcript_4279/g.9393 Transcript_4279/m.9393 type:complete len:315 (-) Transcript_4279:82-1026(-)